MNGGSNNFNGGSFGKGTSAGTGVGGIAQNDPQSNAKNNNGGTSNQTGNTQSQSNQDNNNLPKTNPTSG